jgi:hypothetical protein
MGQELVIAAMVAVGVYAVVAAALWKVTGRIQR